MRILSVVGARPQFVKLAPISWAIPGRAEHIVVHTGQHYDDAMSDAFFRDLDIAAPDVNLAVGSGSHAEQTATILSRIEPVLTQHRPDWVLVYGDTNSTLAAAIAAVKLELPLAHLEAGLRSFNRSMPEEHNRVLTDHAADLCLAPSEAAMEHLAAERLGECSVLVGDVMTDVLYRTRDKNRDSGLTIPDGLAAGEYYVSTIHRPSNTDDPARLSRIVDELAALDRPVLLLAHPRLVHAARDHGIELDRGQIRVRPPMAYPQLVFLAEHSAGVITDSGGLQKEAFLLRVPCTTIRADTEWVETVDLGWNVLVGDELDRIGEAAARDTPPPTDAAPYGDGHAAARTIDALLERNPKR